MVEVANLKMMWSQEALEGFVDLINLNYVYSGGKRVKVELVEYGNNEVGFHITLTEET